MTEKIKLPHYMRTLLLEEICKRMDIIEYCNSTLELGLVPRKGSIYKGKCPFCRQKEVFSLSKRFGSYSCTSCRATADFLTLIEKSKDYTLNDTLAFLSGYLEEAEDRELAYTGGITSRGGGA